MIYLGITAALLIAFIVCQAWMFNKERREWARERQRMLNRIQAPQQFLAQEFEPTEMKAAVGVEDDEGYWEAVRERNGER